MYLVSVAIVAQVATCALASCADIAASAFVRSRCMGCFCCEGISCGCLVGMAECMNDGVHVATKHVCQLLYLLGCAAPHRVFGLWKCWPGL